MKNRLIERFPLIILMLNLFIALLGQGMVIPILPDYLRQFNAGGAAAGYLVAAFGVAQFLVSPLGGRLSDQYGRKIMIFIGMFLCVISDLIFAITMQLHILYIARFIGGIGLGVMMPSILAYVADLTTKETRGKGMGYISAAINLGIVLGPGIGGIVAQFGVRVPYYSAAGLGFVATILVILLPETLPKEKRMNQKKDSKQETMLKSIMQSIHMPYFKYLILIFVMTFGLMNYETVYSLFVQQKYGFTAREIAIIITLGASIGIVIQMWVINRIIRFLGEKRTIRYSLLIISMALILMLFRFNFIYLLVVSSLFFAANSLLRPTVNTMLSNEAGDQQGFVAGLNTTYASLGSIVGPIIAGNLFEQNIHYPYILGACILLGTIGLVSNRNNILKQEITEIYEK